MSFIKLKGRKCSLCYAESPEYLEMVWGGKRDVKEEFYFYCMSCLNTERKEG